MALVDDLKALVNSAYRDFEQDGVAASGAHEPRKAALRASFGRVIEAIGYVEEIVIGEGYRVEVTSQALQASGAPGEGE